MARAGKWPAAAGRAGAAVQISEDAGVRLLHVGGEAIQSAIRLGSPDALELDYTRAMMAFLLFRPEPQDILMIGLGGGSIARFVHRRLASARMTVIEIRAEVIAAARQYFDLPAEDDRLTVVAGDGAAWVPAHAGCADVLLLDAFEDGEHAQSLCTGAFYDAARAALKRGGVLAANFIADDRRLDTWIRRIERSFEGRCLRCMAEDKVNMIVLAFQEGPARVAWGDLKERARMIASAHGLSFARHIASLKALNAHTARHLLIGPQ